MMVLGNHIGTTVWLYTFSLNVYWLIPFHSIKINILEVIQELD